MANPSFSASLPGNGPYQYAENQDNLCGVHWSGAPGTEFKYNPIPNDVAGYCCRWLFIDGVQIGQLDANLSGELCAVTYKGMTYYFTPSGRYPFRTDLT
ncbi:hypothetical protein MUN82_10050 [Hymenobacter aerilatus]|uniref:Uncharacterized protein n=1 Tax=Hymenobacter aerilatus TaxID=2932251 RepID=A0A8T9T199_9BACT|nr:hypothetical protein [Hymenobacter aerilatus]UOR07421.1 hypothetical protein MUN82_10050 [Hymenobacter aerilatus]